MTSGDHGVASTHSSFIIINPRGESSILRGESSFPVALLVVSRLKHQPLQAQVSLRCTEKVLAGSDAWRHDVV